MHLRQLEYIIMLEETQQANKAADRCGVAHSTLCYMVQKLEEELGVKLFDRNSQRTLPTPAGERVLTLAKEILAQVSCMGQVAQEANGSMNGVVRLGILPTVAPYLLPRFFPLFRKQHPETDLHVLEMKTDELNCALDEGQIDAAIWVNLKEKRFNYQKSLYFEQFVGYVSRESRLFGQPSLRSSDLQHEYLWLLDEGHCFRDQLVKFCHMERAQESRKAYSLGSIETFMRMVEGGQGVTFIPELAVDQLTKSQRELVRPFALPTPTREIVLTCSDKFVRYSLLDLIRDAILAKIPKRMQTLQPTQLRI